MMTDNTCSEENEVLLTVGEDAIKKWANVKRISPHSAECLLDMGFNSMEALSLLTPSDLEESPIPLGQRKLLIHSVKQTFPRGMAAATSTDRMGTPMEDRGGQNKPAEDTSDASFIRDIMGQLHQAQGQPRPTTQPMQASNGMYSWQDPQIYLKSLVPSNSSNYLDIVDQSERVLSNNDDGQLIFKSGPAKPKLESISISQWSVANLGIMHKLLQDSSLHHDQILDYLSYTTRIYQLFSSHEVKSVYFYDREYRRLQHNHKFRWGD